MMNEFQQTIYQAIIEELAGLPDEQERAARISAKIEELFQTSSPYPVKIDIGLQYSLLLYSMLQFEGTFEKLAQGQPLDEQEALKNYLAILALKADVLEEAPDFFAQMAQLTRQLANLIKMEEK
jgi:hypothetical protein